MQKEFLENLLVQNKMTSSFAINKISNENAGLRLNQQAASIGFIYRHIGETINLFGTFFGIPTDVQNTTMGESDKGQGKNIKESITTFVYIVICYNSFFLAFFRIISPITLIFYTS